LGGDVTFGVVVVREVCEVGRARCEDAPEGTARLPVSETGEVNMTSQAAFFKRLGKVIGINLVSVKETGDQGEVHVSI
jgi:hypothetical protein